MAKTGVDDFLAAGGTVAELVLMARPFEPKDISCERLSRDERLRTGTEDLWRRWRAYPWRTKGDYTARSLVRALIRLAEKSGKPTDVGIRVIASKRTLALEAGVSARSVTSAVPRAEEFGFARRDNEGRKRDEAGAFILPTEGARYFLHNGERGLQRRRSKVNRKGRNLFSCAL